MGKNAWELETVLHIQVRPEDHIKCDSSIFRNDKQELKYSEKVMRTVECILKKQDWEIEKICSRQESLLENEGYCVFSWLAPREAIRFIEDKIVKKLLPPAYEDDTANQEDIEYFLYLLLSAAVSNTSLAI